MGKKKGTAVKMLVLAAVMTTLAGCGGESGFSSGHGFSGEWKPEGADGDRVMIIGQDFVKFRSSNHTKHIDLAKIFVRETDDERRLVFQKESGSEKMWKILDEDAIKGQMGFSTVVMKRQ